MTFLKRVLTFDRPIREAKCQSCDGTGKIKNRSTYSGGTLVFCIAVGGVFFATLLEVVAKKNLVMTVPLFIISAILGIATLMEAKEQKK